MKILINIITKIKITTLLDVFAKGRLANLFTTSVTNFKTSSQIIKRIFEISFKFKIPKASAIKPKSITNGISGNMIMFTIGATKESVPKVIKVKGSVPSIAAKVALNVSDNISGRFLKKLVKGLAKKNNPSKLPKLNCRLKLV